MCNNNILITGAAGFIGSSFIRKFLIKHPSYNVIALDKLTYAGNIHNLDDIYNKIKFIKGDICDFDLMVKILEKNNINGIINFAAETHVDKSISIPNIFVHTNVLGTQNLLESARRVWLEGSQNKFIQISTDEVYGSLGKSGYFFENTPIDPSSPYSASKAGSELIAKSYYKTFKMNVTITNCSNNYGPHQHNEKLIPHIIKCAIKNEPIPIYGNGKNIRDWLYVEDHCEAIDLVFHKGEAGEKYNIGANEEKQNIDIAKLILKQLNKPESLIHFVEDRKGHDYRYAINSDKIRNNLGWYPKVKFEEGISKTISWYLNNTNWLHD